MDWQSTNTMLYTATARYDWSNDKHAVGALVGTSYEHYKYERLAGSREEFPSDALTDMEAGSTSGAEYTNGAGSSEYKMLSYFCSCQLYLDGSVPIRGKYACRRILTFP
ncbi:hypothetical protein NXW72_23255 [Bacteroides fragilis]|nr:hypothetical protein [Bacteroides fragilis]